MAEIETGEPREEPHCGTCGDTGEVLEVPPATEIINRGPCPECEPESYAREYGGALPQPTVARPECTSARHPAGWDWCDDCAPF